MFQTQTMCEKQNKTNQKLFDIMMNASKVLWPMDENETTAPANRVASVSQGHRHQKPPSHHPQQQQQPPPGYHSSSRPPHPSSNCPPQHHQPPPSGSSSSRSSLPPQHVPQKPPPKAQQQQMQQQQQQQSSRSSRSSSDTATESSGGKELTEAEKKEKEKFLMFTRVLMKILEQRDNDIHQKANAQIKECYEKNRIGDPAFKSLYQSMRARLRATVGETYWKKAHDYLDDFFRQKQDQKKDESSGQSSSRSSSQQQPSSSSSIPISTSKSTIQPSSCNAQAAALKMPLTPGKNQNAFDIMMEASKVMWPPEENSAAKILRESRNGILVSIIHVMYIHLNFLHLLSSRSDWDDKEIVFKVLNTTKLNKMYSRYQKMIGTRLDCLSFKCGEKDVTHRGDNSITCGELGLKNNSRILASKNNSRILASKSPLVVSIISDWDDKEIVFKVLNTTKLNKMYSRYQKMIGTRLDCLSFKCGEKDVTHRGDNSITCRELKLGLKNNSRILASKSRYRITIHDDLSGNKFVVGARKCDKMWYLFETYASCHGLSSESLQFMYNGENISLGADNRNNDISIEDLGMKETDSMIVFTEFDDITPSDHDCHDEILSITVEDECRKYLIIVAYKTELQEIFVTYANRSGKPLRSIRIKHNGERLFLSRAKKMTIGELGFENNDLLVASTVVTDQFEEAASTKPSKMNPTVTSNNKKIQRCSPQQRSPWAGIVENTDSEEYHRKRHSEKIGVVFEEAQPKLAEIRKKLNDLNIKCNKPKDKSKVAKSPETKHPEDSNAIMAELGSKAGRSSFVVNVGEVTNLYKTSKYFKHKPIQPTIILDLHGHSTEHALAILNENLSSWIVKAMGGVYPFVIQVEIICGKGNQVLSEVVERWIKCQKQVANAPQSRH